MYVFVYHIITRAIYSALFTSHHMPYIWVVMSFWGDLGTFLVLLQNIKPNSIKSVENMSLGLGVLRTTRGESLSSFLNEASHWVLHIVKRN